MNWRETRQVLVQLLRQKNYPLDELERLLSYVSGLAAPVVVELPLEGKLRAPQEEKLREVINKLHLDTPIAYIVGYQDFAGLRFEVSPSVLIPRPETENLIQPEKILKIAQQNTKCWIIDVGTGSGNIITATYHKLYHLWQQKSTKSRHFHDQFSFFAVDSSAPALAVAERNAAKILAGKGRNVHITFINGYLLGEVLGLYRKQRTPKPILLILANLPYIPLTDYQKLDPSVKHEPHSALVPPDQRNLVQELVAMAPPGAYLFLEDVDLENNQVVFRATIKGGD